MIVLQKESTERRGLLVQFHEEDLAELRTALHALREVQHGEEPVPEWVGRLEGAIAEQQLENRDHP